jgi:hypothetical protein
MRPTIIAGLAALTLAATSSAEVLNVEFKFTPFTGDRATQDAVTTVPGLARVFLNGVPYADQEVGAQEVPVLFDDREIAPAVWLPTESCGPVLRKGTNTIRIDFEPADPGASYRVQLRWASVMSEATEERGDGTYAATNQAGEGAINQEAKGKVSLERTFEADFATDLPWHHAAPVTTLDAADRAALLALAMDRLDAFQPGFTKLYALIEAKGVLDLAELKDSKCLDAAYEAGIRLAAPPEDGIDLVLTGNPEVIIRAKEGNLYFPADRSAIEKITDPEVQMCIGAALMAAYPPRLAVARGAGGAWEVVY